MEASSADALKRRGDVEARGGGDVTPVFPLTLVDICSLGEWVGGLKRFERVVEGGLEGFEKKLKECLEKFSKGP